MALHILDSLINILEQDQHHLNIDSKSQIESFLEKARSLRDTFPIDTFDIGTDLERRIIDVAHEAEDVIEVHITNRILLPDDISQLDLTYLPEKFESIKEDIGNKNYARLLCIRFFGSTPVIPSLQKRDPSRNKNDFIGREHDFQTLKARLIQGPPQLQIITIYGVVGVGKMTLARKLYNDSFITSHFDILAWVVAPLQVDVRNLLLRILQGLGISSSEIHRQNEDQLGKLVRNSLKNRRYFIVIRDIGFIENWNKVRRSFPDDNKGCRIVLLIPEKETEDGLGFIQGHEEAKCFGNAEPHKLDGLNPHESWLLFCYNVFEQEDCPDELKSIGKHIVRMCRGIPLLVSLIGRMLVTFNNVIEYWQPVVEILSPCCDPSRRDLYYTVSHLSCTFLPYYVKPCFLYAGGISLNLDIHASRIIKLWVAEGFVKQTADNCPEDLAKAYLEILADKNLIAFSREEPNGKVKTFQVHPFLAINCRMLALVTNFSESVQADGLLTLDNIMIMRPMGAHPLTQSSGKVEGQSFVRSFLEVEGQSFVRSFLATERPSLSLAGKIIELRLLRVLDVFQLQFYQFPTEILQLVLLRYLAFSCYSNLSTSISRLRNLQTLIIRRLPSFRAFSLPSELWEMSQLRHVKCKETFFWYYPRNGERVVQCKLQTLSHVQVAGVTSEFLENIQSIRKLGIFCNMAMNSFIDLACLRKLEKLKCSSDWSLASCNFLSHLTFPPSLRKLTLSLCRIPLRFMKVVGSLPNLEELKLQKSDFLGLDTGPTEPEWEPSEGEFPKLLSLVMVDLNLVHWNAHSTHFPRLRHLVIQNCYAMVEIPLDIGDIQTLELIKVNKRSTPSFIASAMQIKEKQGARGNISLQVHITRN